MKFVITFRYAQLELMKLFSHRRAIWQQLDTVFQEACEAEGII